ASCAAFIEDLTGPGRGEEQTEAGDSTGGGGAVAGTLDALPEGRAEDIEPRASGSEPRREPVPSDHPACPDPVVPQPLPTREPGPGQGFPVSEKPRMPTPTPRPDPAWQPVAYPRLAPPAGVGPAHGAGGGFPWWG